MTTDEKVAELEAIVKRYRMSAGTDANERTMAEFRQAAWHALELAQSKGYDTGYEEGASRTALRLNVLHAQEMDKKGQLG